MTGVINKGKYNETSFTKEDYLEVEQAAEFMRKVREQLTPTQRKLLAGGNEYDTNEFDIEWDEIDEDKHCDLWDRLNANLIYGN